VSGTAWKDVFMFDWGCRCGACGGLLYEIEIFIPGFLMLMKLLLIPNKWPVYYGHSIF
jgi:hypothetical protein